MLGFRCCTGFSLVVGAGATLHCSAWASINGGFSYCGSQALGHKGLVIVVHGLTGRQILYHSEPPGKPPVPQS